MYLVQSLWLITLWHGFMSFLARGCWTTPSLILESINLTVFVQSLLMASTRCSSEWKKWNISKMMGLTGNADIVGEKLFCWLGKDFSWAKALLLLGSLWYLFYRIYQDIQCCCKTIFFRTSKCKMTVVKNHWLWDYNSVLKEMFKLNIKLTLTSNVNLKTMTRLLAGWNPNLLSVNLGVLNSGEPENHI